MSINRYVLQTLLLGAFTISVAAHPGRAQSGSNRGTTIKPGESCPPVMTEVRPRNCQPPADPAPSILDYRPKSTLVVPAHMVRQAKYPAIDFHGHPFGMLGSTESLARLGADLDALNVRMIIVANNVSGDDLKQTVATVKASPAMKDRVRVLTGIDCRNV